MFHAFSTKVNIDSKLSEDNRFLEIRFCITVELHLSEPLGTEPDSDKWKFG